MMEIKSISEALTYLYDLSLNQSNYRFRGQSNDSWSLIPSIYRYSDFMRYQTTFYEKYVLDFKPPNSWPPLTYTSHDLEWLMLCQHYEIPTRLMDWTIDIPTALFFACWGGDTKDKNGALYVCNYEDYPLFHNWQESISKTQELAFVSTHVTNPRMRGQHGCFMMWGHAPKKDSTETYDLIEYHNKADTPFFLEKLIIPAYAKQNILKELRDIYSISLENIYIINGYLEKEYGAFFRKIREESRLKTLYITQADKLNYLEEVKAIRLFRIICKDMFRDCYNIRGWDL